MHRKLNIALALAAGLLGGLLSHWIAVPSVLAQARPVSPVELRAQRFSLVDPQGEVIGTFTSAPPLRPEKSVNPYTPPRIVLVDPSGHELWAAGGGFRILSENSK